MDAAVRHKLNRDPISDAFIILLEFQEDGSSEVIRAAANNEDVISNGNTYTAADISVTLPGSSDVEQFVSIEMSNVHREPGKAINRSRNRIGVKFLFIDSSDPDTYLYQTYNMMVLQQVSLNSIRITGSIGPRARLNEPYPFRPTTKTFFPALWFTQ